MVCVRALRTQQRAKSQCTCTYPVMGGWVGDGLVSETDAKIVSMAGLASRTRHPSCQQPAAGPRIVPRLHIDIQWRV